MGSSQFHHPCFQCGHSCKLKQTIWCSKHHLFNVIFKHGELVMVCCQVKLWHFQGVEESHLCWTREKQCLVMFVVCHCQWSFPLESPSWAPTEHQHTMDCCFGQDGNHKFMDLFCECLHLFGQKTVTLQWKWTFPDTTSISCSTPFHCLLVLKPVETHSSDCDGKP